MLDVKNIEGILKDTRKQFLQMPKRSSEKARQSSILKPYIADIEAKAAELQCQRIEELPFSLFKRFDTDGNRTSYEKVYFARRCRLTTFGTMYWLYGRKKDLQALEDVLWAVCNEFTWALPAHMGGKSLKKEGNPCTIDLFAAETAQTLAEMMYYFGENLDPAITFRCQSEIHKRVLGPFLESKAPMNWETMKNNWCAVCAGSIGMTAIYQLQDEQTLAAVLHRLFPTLQRFLESFEDDGTCLEGLSYWNYGVLYYTAFASLLKERVDHAIDLLEQPKFRKIAQFQSFCYFNDGRTISFADGSSREKYNMGLTSYIIKQLGENGTSAPPLHCAGGFNSDPCYRWCAVFRTLLWTDEMVLESIKAVESCKVLPRAQWMICNNELGIGAAVKGGTNDEPHNHNDVGSFLVYMRGGELLSDLGAGEYTKEYFSEKRYRIFCNSSLSHNVPIINGHVQCAGAKFRAGVCSFKESGAMCVDLANAYDDPFLKQLRREVKVKKNEILLNDRFCFSCCPTSIKERFITRQKPKVNAGEVVLFTETNETASLYYDRTLFDVIVTNYKHQPHEGTDPETIYAIDFTSNCLKENMEIVFSIQWI